jgi:LmbE family N-acetylglucosaminyl deacetylase
MLTYKEIFDTKQNVLIVTAHPDDCIVYFCGLIHKLRSENKDVYVLAVSNGARGGDGTMSEDDLAKQRIQEEIDALSTLDVPKENFACLNYKDGDIESNLELIQKIVKYIVEWKADIVCTHDPAGQYIPTYDKSGFFIQHRDHRKVGEAVIDAVYPFSRHKSFFPENTDPSASPKDVYDILLTDENTFNMEIDMADNLDIKRKALAAHKSQMTDEHVEDIINAFSEDGKFFERFNYLKLLW